MKKIGIKFCAIVALFCGAGGVVAKEIPTGTIEIGGQTDLSFNSSTTSVEGTDVDVDTTTMKVQELYYVMPNVGIGILWSYEKTETSVGDTSLTETMNFFAATASYNLSINEHTSFRPKLYIGIASMKDDDSFDASGTGWGLGAELSHFPSDHLSFDFGVSYESFSLSDDGLDVDFDTSGLTFGVGLTGYLR